MVVDIEGPTRNRGKGFDSLDVSSSLTKWHKIDNAGQAHWHSLPSFTFERDSAENHSSKFVCFVDEQANYRCPFIFDRL